jgi:hypothetical protein
MIRIRGGGGGGGGGALGLEGVDEAGDGMGLRLGRSMIDTADRKS